MILSGYFSATETAFQKLNRFKFEVAARDDEPVAKSVLWLNERFERVLSTILLGNTLANTAVSVLFTMLFYSWVQKAMQEGTASIVSSIILTLFLYLFCETIPKQVAAKIPNKVAKINSIPLLIFYFLFWPITFLSKYLTKLIQIIFKKQEEPDFTEEDFTLIIEQNEEGGLLEKNESDLIVATLDWGETLVTEVMTNFDDAFMISVEGKTNKEIVEQICLSNFSRIPVYANNDRQNIVGILIVKKYLAAYLNDKDLDINKYLEKPFTVSPYIELQDLAEGFRRKKTQLALIKKNGEYLGLVSMEDCLEELIGPMHEEYKMEKKRK